MAYSVSPNGSQISFGANKRGTAEREIWLMNTDGKRAVKFLQAEGESPSVGSYGRQTVNELSTLFSIPLEPLRWLAVRGKEGLRRQSFRPRR